MRTERMLIGCLSALLAVVRPVAMCGADTRVVEVVADNDNQFKVPGENKPVIRLKPRERVRLRITARKGPEWNKDGTIHSFTIVSPDAEGGHTRVRAHRPQRARNLQSAMHSKVRPRPQRHENEIAGDTTLNALDAAGTM